MKCKYCEAEIPDKEKICRYCGRFLSEETVEDPAKKRRRRLLFALGAAGIVIAFVLTTFGMMMSNQQRTNEHLAQQVAVSSANNLNMTFDAFKENFNQNDAARQSKFNISAVALNKSENDARFHYAATDKLVLNGLVGKLDHKLLEIQMLGVPGNTREDQRRFVAMIGVLIDLFSPELYDDEKLAVLKELGFNKETDLTKADNTVVRGNVKYTFKFIKDTGFILLIKNVNRQ